LILRFSVSRFAPSFVDFTLEGFTFENLKIGTAGESIAFSFKGKSIGDCSRPSLQSHSQSSPSFW
jgi:hypothetical protein